MIDLVDTHCHIQSAGGSLGEQNTAELWARDPELTGNNLVASASEAGVKRLICVGCDLPDSKLAIDFVAKRDNCHASLGIHPHEASNYVGHPELLQEFASLATRPKVMAVGECGLDYFYNHSIKADQIVMLRFQIELALKHDLPLIFHVREAFDDFWPVFDSYSNIRGVLHSFTDNQANLDKAIERGLFIGVNGIATFAKNPQQLDVYRAIPPDRLVLETDAPYLTPTPYRGRLNTPKQVETIARFVAELRAESLEYLSKATTSNALKLFGLN